MKTPRIAMVIGLFVCGLVPASDAIAQSATCSKLLAQINSAGGGEGGKYAAAAQKQRAEISRTEAYANSIGCENRQFLFFGKAAPPQCVGIKARISQMQSNYNGLVGASENAGSGRKAALQAQYQANCVRQAQPETAAAQPQRGLFDGLFSPNRPAQRYEDVPIDKQDLRGSDSAEDDAPRHGRGGRVAICVKMLDGGFFPVSYSARGADLEDLDTLCKALCPATEVMVFTWNPNGDLDDAVDINDRAYSEIPNRLKFQTKYVPEAACKPNDKSWAEVLGPAEQALGTHSKHDILVTKARAAELSLGKNPNVLSALAGNKKTTAADDAEVEAFTAELSKATAPNGSSSGIGGGRASSGPVISVTQGELKDQIGPDGVTRKVRIIAPAL